MSMAYEEYMKQMVKPMRDELVQSGFQELVSAEDVEQYMENAEGTTLVVVNSVCGCAAGLARPAGTMQLKQVKRNQNICNCFCGSR